MKVEYGEWQDIPVTARDAATNICLNSRPAYIAAIREGLTTYLASFDDIDSYPIRQAAHDLALAINTFELKWGGGR